MPNHVHCLIYSDSVNINLNKFIANGKRFLAYEIVKRLNTSKKHKLLEVLKMGVGENEKRKGKKHQVFQLSFDGKMIDSREMLEDILDYIHHNPVKGKWQLVEDYACYEHSSASFYELNKTSKFVVTDYREFY